MQTERWMAIPAIALVLALGACGGDSGGTTTVTVAAPAGPATTTAPATTDAAGTTAAAAAEPATSAVVETTTAVEVETSTGATPEEVSSMMDDVSAQVNEELAAECGKQLRPLADALQELDSRLDIGLTYAEYGDQVANVKVAYDRVDWEKGMAGPGCARTAILLERGLRKYAAAHERWQACIESPDCLSDSITTKLQAAWADASKAVDQGVERLNELENA